MIVDLNQNLYIVDRRTHEHRILFMDIVNKYVYVENFDGAEEIADEIKTVKFGEEESTTYAIFYYGTNIESNKGMTVIIK